MWLIKNIAVGLLFLSMMAAICYQFVEVLDWEAQRAASRGRVIPAVYVVGQ